MLLVDDPFGLRVDETIVARMIRDHQKEIQNYFHLRITNATVEGVNDKAQVISHRAD